MEPKMLYAISTNIHHDYFGGPEGNTPWENSVVSIWEDKNRAYEEYKRLLETDLQWSNHPLNDNFIMNECELNVSFDP